MVALLDTVLYRFRYLFGSQNFSLFCACLSAKYLYGLYLRLLQIRHSLHNFRLFFLSIQRIFFFSSIEALNLFNQRSVRFFRTQL